jgi:hypothetical protein
MEFPVISTCSSVTSLHPKVEMDSRNTPSTYRSSSTSGAGSKIIRHEHIQQSLALEEWGHWGKVGFECKEPGVLQWKISPSPERKL